jgi:hypothetical protein
MKNFKILLSLTVLFIFTSCQINTDQAKSDSGVQKASVTVKTDETGKTVEQNNYIERVKRDNELGSTKHLYIISSYTGDVLEYSTVKGKVTSGQKRLSPSSVTANSLNSSQNYSNWVILNNQAFTTTEVPDEYGMYGSSSSYFYWFDAQGNYHQYFPSGGTFVHISDRPLRIKKANFSLNIE